MAYSDDRRLRSLIMDSLEARNRLEDLQELARACDECLGCWVEEREERRRAQLFMELYLEHYKATFEELSETLEQLRQMLPNRLV